MRALLQKSPACVRVPTSTHSETSRSRGLDAVCSHQQNYSHFGKMKMPLEREPFLFSCFTCGLLIFGASGQPRLLGWAGEAALGWGSCRLPSAALWVGQGEVKAWSQRNKWVVLARFCGANQSCESVWVEFCLLLQQGSLRCSPSPVAPAGARGIRGVLGELIPH